LLRKWRKTLGGYFFAALCIQATTAACTFFAKLVYRGLDAPKLTLVIWQSHVHSSTALC